jgi:hypothetical protein
MSVYFKEDVIESLAPGLLSGAPLLAFNIIGIKFRDLFEKLYPIISYLTFGFFFLTVFLPMCPPLAAILSSAVYGILTIHSTFLYYKCKGKARKSVVVTSALTILIGLLSYSAFSSYYQKTQNGTLQSKEEFYQKLEEAAALSNSANLTTN